MCVNKCGSAQVDAPPGAPPPPGPRCSYQPPLGLDERPVLPVHLVVEAAGVTQVVPGAVPPPQRGGCGPAVDALPAFCKGTGDTGSHGPACCRGLRTLSSSWAGEGPGGGIQRAANGREGSGPQVLLRAPARAGPETGPLRVPLLSAPSSLPSCACLSWVPVPGPQILLSVPRPRSLPSLSPASCAFRQGPGLGWKLLLFQTK